MEPKKISKKMLKRLPVYLEYLKSLPEHSNHVSATSIAKALGLGDVQVRKDLAKISNAGRRRTGRSREQLIQDIERYLDLATQIGIVIVGAGKLGQTLLNYSGFEESGLTILAAFDLMPAAEQTETGKPIYPMNRLESFCRSHDIRIGIIAVPADNAQEVCNTLVSCGIKAIWNFAPVILKVPDSVIVQSENLAVSLTALRLQVKETDKTE
jgi:redox-sensing transcriptional repressor